MTTEIKSSEIVFFLGAGASVAAGVPDTFSFVNEFIDVLRDSNKKVTIKKIVQTLENGKEPKKIDVEDLLETLTKLENREKEPLLKFYDVGDFILKGYSEKEPLIDDLKDFIKSKAIVSEEKIQYLQSLLGFVAEFRPLDIISVNYDTCIEQFCNVHKLDYQDGFDVHWNPKTFAAEHVDIRLYKLHGSVMWYQSNKGGYIKLPIMTEVSKIQLITGESAENLILYPMQKWDYAEPLLELLVEIKHLLESETCKFLIVVGYSFRDNHIRRILWDAARKNKELHLILVDPKAYQIYSEKLKYYDEKQRNPSSLYGKVICLPYLFEKVFPLLKNYYLANFKAGLNKEKALYQDEIKGGKADWMSCIKDFVNAEHIEKVEDLLNKEGVAFEPDNNWERSLEISLKVAIILSANNREDEAIDYFKNFGDLLHILMVERMNVAVMKPPPVIEVLFNYRSRGSGGSYNGMKQFKNVIESLSEFCETRTKFVKSAGKTSQKITEKLKKLKHYFESFDEEGKIKFEDYMKLRGSKIPNADHFKEVYNDNSKPLDKVISTVINVEESILEEILKEE